MTKKKWFGSELIDNVLAQIGLGSPYPPRATPEMWEDIKEMQNNARGPVPHVYQYQDLWCYRNSIGASYAFTSVSAMSRLYEQYEPNPCYWRSLPATFTGIRPRTRIGYTGGER
jgi:hypothetical protein